jgi:cell division protein FtsI (penicillin-binding protein 3)
VAAVKTLNFKGIEYLSEHARFYPNTTLAAQVLGFVGIDGHGLEGLEFYYDDELKGRDQKFTLLKDALGRGFDTDSNISDQGRAGNNLILTLDSQIQYITEQALAEAVTRHKALSGMAIVMDPRTGALLALANYPFFNPNDFSKFQRSVWRNRAITDTFEPGSTMKIFSTAAALEHQIADPATIFFCENGLYTVGGHQIHDTKSHGWLSVQQIMKYSSNIGTVKLAEKIGRQMLYEQFTIFGFGAPTLIDCPGETAGSLSHYKHWTSVDIGSIAFGQGIAVTALQLISAVAALANDGWMMQPYILQAVTNSEGTPVHTVTPKTLRQVVSADTAATMRRIMRTVITEGGTGVQADVDGHPVCGKTGTAQKLAKTGGYADDRYIASFLGLVPTEKPALAILVVVDEPQDTNYGGIVAAPVFRRIAKESLGYLNIVPDKDWHKFHVSTDHNVSG